MSRDAPRADPDAPLARLAQALAALEQAAAELAMEPPLRPLLDALDHALRDVRQGAAREHGMYRALFDAVPDPVSIIGRDGVVLDVNQASLRAYGRPRTEIVGRPIELLNPDLPPGHMGPVLEALDRGETYVVQATNMRADGSRFPVEVHSANLDFDGRRAIVAVARDLSARREAEARYFSLIEHIDQALTVQDGDGRIHYMNAAAMRLYGLDAEAEDARSPAADDDWLVLDVHGRRLPDAEDPPARALRSGHTVAGEVIGLYRRSRRQLLWLAMTAVPQFAPGADRADRVLVLASDITALQRDTTLFRRVQELAMIGGWQWDRASGALYLTGEARRILGAARAPDSMPAVLACLLPEDAARLQRTLDSIRDGTGFELELEGRQHDGSPFWVRMIGEPDPHDPAHARISGTLQDITERRRAEEALRTQAQTDALTGLLNRNAILAQIEHRLRAPDGPDLGLLYIDLDRFKIVNDMQGHDAGDRLLVEAAQRIRAAVGDEGRIARFGGDEFLVICRTADDPTRSERLARQVQQAFQAPFRLGKDEFTVTTSIGIAHAPQDGDTPRRLIQSADVAMYDSKHRRRDGFQAFSPQLAQRQHLRLQIETQLRRALDNGEFHLVYQPQVDLRSGRILSAEALLRWNSPALGALPPDRFIALAESTGEIARIDHWVLREATAQLRRWQDAGLAIGRMAVNVSYHQFIGEDLARGVEQALQANGLPGHALELELTERVLVEDSHDALRILEGLRALGVLLSIDDFGEGYSALNYLRRLPIHALKLSHGFLKGVPRNASDVAICQTVLGIARSLGLGTVAEGVESEAQRDFLLRQGVTLGQGFLFAPGLPPGEFARRLAAQST